MTKQKFIIIDGNALLHRAWHAIPPLTTKKGEVVNAVYGFCSILLKVIKELKPNFLAVAWDLPGKTFRHEVYKEYKATREKKPQELYDQIIWIKQILKAFNILSLEQKGFEADDIIATLCQREQVNDPNVDSIIVTGDLDTLQLVDANTFVYSLKKGISDIVIYDRAKVKERYGLEPEQLIDFKALRGDDSDNISGVPGVGDKTASELLKSFETLEKLYRKLDEGEAELKPKLRENLINDRERVYENKKLVTLIRNLNLDFKLEQARLGSFDREAVVSLFRELEFVSLLSKIPENRADQASLFSEKSLPMDEKYQIFKSSMVRSGPVSIFVISDQAHFSSARIAGMAITNRAGAAYYLPESRLIESKAALAEELIGYDLKYLEQILKARGLEMGRDRFDAMIASYLLNPGSRAHALEDIIFSEIGQELVSLEKILKEYDSFTIIPEPVLIDFSCRRADYLFQVKEKILAKLKDSGLTKVFREIEMPLIPVLARMERFGVKIDSGFLSKHSAVIAHKIKEISEKVFTLAGEKFNISSPSQLKKILFEKLKIPVARIRKTKTGLSTAASELEKMRGLHPIIDLISEYRELAKLSSTYLEALPLLVNPNTGRVHTTFNQAVAATGRLSSSDPNLQNIPIRTEIGRQVRKAFIAEPGYKILTADYSQIELRVVAALAHDQIMIDTFKRGEDIHTRTASEIYGVPADKVTTEMRYAAKTINFGLIYGQGPNALAQQTGLSLEEAKEFISKYFQLYPKVREYLDGLKEQARQKGYVETLFGRKRYLAEINSGVPVIRAQAERMAINMPVQGTAADLMKLAMINIDRELYSIPGNSEGAKARMILQVHDELVFEVREDQVDAITNLVKDKMELVHELTVPLVVKVRVGDSWGDLN